MPIPLHITFKSEESALNLVHQLRSANIWENIALHVTAEGEYQVEATRKNLRNFAKVRE